MITLMAAFSLGLISGLRSLMTPAVTAWAVHLGWLKIDHPLSLIGALPSVIILTLLAIGELVADKLPQTPSRTAPPGLIARIVTGGFAGACITANLGQGILLGAVGAVIGCFAGYQARTRLVKTLAVRDLYVALVEDLVALMGALFIVSRVAQIIDRGI